MVTDTTLKMESMVFDICEAIAEIREVVEDFCSWIENCSVLTVLQAVNENVKIREIKNVKIREIKHDSGDFGLPSGKPTDTDWVLVFMIIDESEFFFDIEARASFAWVVEVMAVDF